MNFSEILQSSRPGDDLAAWQGSWPVFLDLAREIPAGPLPWHTGSLLDHLARCMNETAGDPLAVWMALCHDCGKLTTPKAMLPHHYAHETRGEKLARVWASQLGLPCDYAEAGVFAAGWHMRAGRYPALRPGKKLKILEAVAWLGLEASFWKVIDADTRAPISAYVKIDQQNLASAIKAGASRDGQLRALTPRQAGFAA